MQKITAGVMSSIVKTLIRFYQVSVSPYINKGMRCKFYPSCSEYAILAIEKYGLAKGVFKTIKRVLRCNPFVKQHRVDFP